MYLYMCFTSLHVASLHEAFLFSEIDHVTSRPFLGVVPTRVSDPLSFMSKPPFFGVVSTARQGHGVVGYMSWCVKERDVDVALVFRTEVLCSIVSARFFL